MQPGWCQPVRQEFMENECEALPGVAYPGVWDNCSTLNTKTGYDDDDGGGSKLITNANFQNILKMWSVVRRSASWRRSDSNVFTVQHV